MAPWEDTLALASGPKMLWGIIFCEGVDPSQEIILSLIYGFRGRAWVIPWRMAMAPKMLGVTTSESHIRQKRGKPPIGPTRIQQPTKNQRSEPHARHKRS